MSIDISKIKKVRTPDGKEWALGGIRDDRQRMVSALVRPLLECDIETLIVHGCFTPVAEPIEIPLDDWEPQEGDIVEWANGNKYRVDRARLVAAPGDVLDCKHSGTIALFKAAKCKIWRNQ